MADGCPIQEKKGENPYRSPGNSGPASSEHYTLVDGNIRLLRRSLVGFGLVAFVTPVLLVAVTDSLVVDILAIYIAAYGSGIERRDLARFPFAGFLLLLYPLLFVSLRLSSDLFDLSTWFVPVRRSFSPLGLYLILAIWASANAGLMFYFHRIQRSVEQAE